MRQSRYRLSLTAILVLLIAGAQIGFGGGAETEWEQDLTELFKLSCLDNNYCRSKMYEWGQKLQDPSQSLQQQVCEKREHFVAAAKVRGIRPESLAACVFSEHTFLYDILDERVDRDPLRYAHRDPSIGFLQIKISTARLFYAIVNGEPDSDSAISDEEIVNHLMSDANVFHYGFAILEEAITAYRAYDFLIEDKTEILCTLYQLGNPYRRAKNSRDNNRQPRGNFYGYYAKMYEPLAKELLEDGCEDRFIDSRPH